MLGMIARFAIVVSFIFVVLFVLSVYVPQANALVVKDYPIRWVHLAVLGALGIGVKFSSSK
jgi:hypothetical protein